MTSALGRYIAIEGVIGVGKTSLAKLLAERFHARLVLEEPEANPFLPDFYKDPRRYAFQTHMFFLVSRYKDLRERVHPDLFHEGIVADYLFQKDRIFANLNLNDRELTLYNAIAPQLEAEVPTPDLVVYLQAPVATLIDRVHKRGVDYERSIPEQYLARLADAYSRFFYQYEDAPLLIVNSERLNFVDHADHFELLLSHIAGMRGRREFFNLGTQ